MKKLIFAIGALAIFTTFSCNKNSGGNTSILAKDSAEKQSGTIDISDKEYTDRYVAEDGSSTLVTFKNSAGKKEISIASNKMTIKAPQTEVDGTYVDHDYEIIAKNDSIKITQGNNVITLKKARGQ